jgi:phosphoglycerate dehydrogenase-like enzyme
MNVNRPKAAFFLNHTRHLNYVYREQQIEALKERFEIYPDVISESNFKEHADSLKDLDYIFSTWSMPGLGEEDIRKMPELKAVFYAAGTVQGFARPFLKCGVKIFSAWAANAIPVAEFALAQILLSCKGYFRNTRSCATWEERTGRQPHSGLGIYNNSVALIGFGMIGRKLADLLRPFHMDVMVVDPYVTDEVLAAHGCRRVELQEAFETAYVVSNHLPNLPPTKGMLKAEHFSAMRSDATFINTGRGAQVVEEDLIQVLEERPDLTALLDVTLPEPPEKDSRFYSLPNVQLSSHIAGSINLEVVRMADYMIAEYDLLSKGEETRYEVTETLLQTMA